MKDVNPERSSNVGESQGRGIGLDTRRKAGGKRKSAFRPGSLAMEAQDLMSLEILRTASDRLVRERQLFVYTIHSFILFNKRISANLHPSICEEWEGKYRSVDLPGRRHRTLPFLDLRIVAESPVWKSPGGGVQAGWV